MNERRDVPLSDGDAAGEGCDGEGAVDVDEPLVGVPGGDSEAKLGFDTGGGGVEVGEPDGGDGEGGALRTIDDIENSRSSSK